MIFGLELLLTFEEIVFKFKLFQRITAFNGHNIISQRAHPKNILFVKHKTKHKNS